ncbi:dUTPase-like protein [Chytriomyces cf. hyalinus JEL632]|nr:dUTPase-like protein [Chytriomyces cf. hyalinus JEL632]
MLSSAHTATLQVKLLSSKGRLPARGSVGAAGYDLFSAKDVTIPANGRAIVPTDISIAVPFGTYGRVAPRSGLAVKHFLDVGAGVIDADYRGPVGVVLFNFGTADFQVKEGDRVAQLILEKIETAQIDHVQELDETVRGAGGFGSTGIRKTDAVMVDDAVKKVKVDSA